MKILSITAQKPFATGSGVYLSELVRCWQQDGHAQAIVAGYHCGDPLPKLGNVRLYPVFYGSDALPFPVLGMSDEMPYASTRYRDLDEEMLLRFRDAFHSAVAEAVEKEDPDWIVCHHLYLLTALVRQWFPGRRVAGICHGSDLRQLTKTPALRAQILPWIPGLDRIIALQQAQKDAIRAVFGCAPGQISVLGAGYNQRIFYKPRRRLRASRRRLCFAGKITEKKGIFSLFRALEQLPDLPESLQVTLAGGFASEAEERQIRALAVRCRYPVEFAGVLSQSALAELFRSSDVFVLPSFFEGLPLVTIESMACGCRVVCSDLPGLRDWFQRCVPGQRVEFVPLPAMDRADEPDPAQLPAFEHRLARAISKKLSQRYREYPDLSAVSWEGVSRRLLEELQDG